MLKIRAFLERWTAAAALAEGGLWDEARATVRESEIAAARKNARPVQRKRPRLHA